MKDSIGEDTCAVLSLVPATQFFPEEVLLRLGRVPHSKGRLVGHQPTATDTFIDIKKSINEPIEAVIASYCFR